ncbi:MAG: ATP-binding protein [Candidatus Liptonbacteria bacterium]|nr:ATP-binding protein [Candidatus Liptonbacteria bacterium]
MSKSHKPILISTLGFPGSGKTHFARRFAKDCGFFHLSSDRLRLEMFPEPTFRPKEQAAVFRTMDYICEELLRRGISVIYDSNCNRREHRRRLKNIARRCGARYLLLWFCSPVPLALRRLQDRKGVEAPHLLKYYRPVPARVLFSQKEEIEEPRREKHVKLDSSRSYQRQKEEVLNYFHKHERS